jgi:hypothetical protein
MTPEHRRIVGARGAPSGAARSIGDGQCDDLEMGRSSQGMGGSHRRGGPLCPASLGP